MTSFLLKVGTTHVHLRISNRIFPKLWSSTEGSEAFCLLPLLLRNVLHFSALTPKLPTAQGTRRWHPGSQAGPRQGERTLDISGIHEDRSPEQPSSSTHLQFLVTFLLVIRVKRSQTPQFQPLKTQLLSVYQNPEQCTRGCW